MRALDDCDYYSLDDCDYYYAPMRTRSGERRRSVTEGGRRGQTMAGLGHVLTGAQRSIPDWTRGGSAGGSAAARRAAAILEVIGAGSRSWGGGDYDYDYGHGCDCGCSCSRSGT